MAGVTTMTRPSIYARITRLDFEMRTFATTVEAVSFSAPITASAASKRGLAQLVPGPNQSNGNTRRATEMKCPECNRDIGHHALEKNAKGVYEPVIRICPNTGRAAVLDPRTSP